MDDRIALLYMITACEEVDGFCAGYSMSARLWSWYYDRYYGTGLWNDEIRFIKGLLKEEGDG